MQHTIEFLQEKWTHVPPDSSPPTQSTHPTVVVQTPPQREHENPTPTASNLNLSPLLLLRQFRKSCLKEVSLKCIHSTISEPLRHPATLLHLFPPAA